MKKLSEKQIIIQEQAKLIKEKKRRLSLMQQVLRIRKFSRLQQSSIRKRGLMHRWLKGLMILRLYQLNLRMTSVKNKTIIQEQAKLIEEKEKEGSSDALISKDK